MHSSQLSSLLPDDLLHRLESVTRHTDSTLDACLIQAVEDFVTTWEDFRQTCDTLDAAPAGGPCFRAANE